ncbi:MAG: OmpP1/FadL family transporter [Thiobacillus sp.]
MKFTRVFAFMALAGVAGSAFATNGMFSHGYGMKSKGMAGASTATHDDAFFGANNPAAAAFAGNRIDLGADLFSPIREATANVGPAPEITVESDSNYFLIPEFGYNRMMSKSLALGVTVYGNGGMNTDYPQNLYGGAGATGELGVDLMQLIVAPTAAYKLAPNHSFGISALIGYERFKGKGFPNGAGGTMATPGYDDAFGYGVRVGYMGKITPDVTIGAAYASKVDFDELDKYNWLFLDQGNLDLAENYNLGVAWQATPAVKLAFDYQRINYEGVNSIGASVPNRGFGWKNIDVLKLGMEYKSSANLTLRAGYSHTDSPIDGSDPGDVTGNIVAPGVIENHITLGFTYTLASGNELTMAYMHGFKNEVTGASLYGTPGTSDTIQMYQNSLGIQYSWKM